MPAADHPNSWRVFHVCETEGKHTSTLYADIRALDAKDREQARSSLATFQTRAQTGMDLSAMYDAKKCHEAHSYSRTDGSEQKIWRIWGAGKIRIYFVYLDAKRIVVLKVCTKRVDKLSGGEKSELEERAKAVFTCVAKNGFEPREI